MSQPPAELRCPACGCKQSKVKNTRGVMTGRKIRRRRECLDCGWRYLTRETVEPMTEAEIRAVIIDAQRQLVEFHAKHAARPTISSGFPKGHTQAHTHGAARPVSR